jgi:hypothetical protein
MFLQRSLNVPHGACRYLYWGANCYAPAGSANEAVAFRQGLPAGDGVLLYPGEVNVPEMFLKMFPECTMNVP